MKMTILVKESYQGIQIGNVGHGVAIGHQVAHQDSLLLPNLTQYMDTPPPLITTARGRDPT